MKIKYNEQTGEILAWGAMPDLKAGPGEVVEDSDSEVSVTGQIRVGRNQYREKTAQERDVLRPVTEKRLEELKEKSTLTLAEVTEVLKLRGLV